MPGPHHGKTIRRLHLLAQQVRQFQIVEKNIQKLLLAQRELKRVLAFAIIGRFRAAAASFPAAAV